MSGEFTFALAFATGLFGSFHCIGMCSGINGGFNLSFRQDNRLFALFAYHGTRIVTYTLFGVIGALLGRVVVQTGIIGKTQGILMILAGIIVVVLGLNLLGIVRWNKPDRAQTHRVKFAAEPGSVSTSFNPWLAGLLNGLVPCSLVFSVAVQAASTADPLRAGLLMLAFGAGTLPSMVGISLLGASIGSRLSGGLAKLAGVTVVLLGLWTLYEGATFFDIMRGLSNW